jgi:hypothetical protein
MGTQRRCRHLLLLSKLSWVEYATVLMMVVQSQRQHYYSADAAVGFAGGSSSKINVAFVVPRKFLQVREAESTIISIKNKINPLLNIRGGSSKAVDKDEEEEESATDVNNDGEEVEEEEEEEEDDKQEEEFDASLAAATVKSSTKTKIKDESSKATAAKNSLNEKLTQAATAATGAIKIHATTPKKKKSKNVGILEIIHVPYILRACLNPLIFFSMTKSYWASLFSLDYPPKVRLLKSPCSTHHPYV